MSRTPQTLIEAPDNPYRPREEDGLRTYAMPGTSALRAPRRHDSERGPGLLASDLNLIATSHYQDGFAAAERQAEAQLDAMRAELASAYDHGFTKGVAERTHGLAQDLYARMMKAHFALVALEQSPKTKRDEAIAAVRRDLNKAMDFVQTLGENDDAAAAVAGVHRIVLDES